MMQNKFLTTLICELVSETNTPDQIQLAGVLFRNCIINKANVSSYFQDKFWQIESEAGIWESQPEEMRGHIKEALMSMLANTNRVVMKAAASCVSAITAVESRHTPVLDIIPILTTNAESDIFNIRLASVQTLGDICEDVDPQYFSEDIINSILFALL